MSELNRLTIAEAQAKLRKREISSRDLTRACLDRIAAVEPKLNAFITVTEREALEQADAADKRLASGDAPPLCGIPLGIKDIYATKGVKTTCASKILENFVPPFDATVIAKLRAEGAVFVGKANMDEFAMGSSTENSAFGPTRNPHDLERVAGGSSGGSAAAVAAYECLASLGTDTGGSIREPASFCGVVGIKPTYSRVSRYGVIAYASSLDQVGPFSRTVRDAAIMLRSLAGVDPSDSTCSARAGARLRARADRRREGTAHRGAEGIFRRGDAAGSREIRPRGARQSAKGRRAHRRNLAAAYLVCGRRVLPGRDRRGVGESLALRRHPLRAARARREQHRAV